MGAVTALNAETQGQPVKPKKKREYIALIETQPKDEWFVCMKTSHGRPVWYLRLQMTGLNPRLFGPFSSKWQALLFLDDAISEINEVENELKDACEKRMVRDTFKKVWPPIIEYPLSLRGRQRTQKGQ